MKKSTERTLFDAIYWENFQRADRSRLIDYIKQTENSQILSCFYSTDSLGINKLLSELDDPASPINADELMRTIYDHILTTDAVTQSQEFLNNILRTIISRPRVSNRLKSSLLNEFRCLIIEKELDIDLEAFLLALINANIEPSLLLQLLSNPDSSELEDFLLTGRQGLQGNYFDILLTTYLTKNPDNATVDIIFRPRLFSALLTSGRLFELLSPPKTVYMYQLIQDHRQELQEKGELDLFYKLWMKKAESTLTTTSTNSMFLNDFIKKLYPIAIQNETMKEKIKELFTTANNHDKALAIISSLPHCTSEAEQELLDYLLSILTINAEKVNFFLENVNAFTLMFCNASTDAFEALIDKMHAVKSPRKDTFTKEQLFIDFSSLITPTLSTTLNANQKKMLIEHFIRHLNIDKFLSLISKNLAFLELLIQNEENHLIHLNKVSSNYYMLLFKSINYVKKPYMRLASSYKQIGWQAPVRIVENVQYVQIVRNPNKAFCELNNTCLFSKIIDAESVVTTKPSKEINNFFIALTKENQEQHLEFFLTKAPDLVLPYLMKGHPSAVINGFKQLNEESQRYIVHYLLEQRDSTSQITRTTIDCINVFLLSYDCKIFDDNYISRIYTPTSNINEIITSSIFKGLTLYPDSSRLSSSTFKTHLINKIFNEIWKIAQLSENFDYFITFLAQQELDDTTLCFIDRISTENPILKQELNARCIDLMPKSDAIITDELFDFLQNRLAARWASIQESDVLSHDQNIISRYITQVIKPLVTTNSSDIMQRLSYTTLNALISDKPDGYDRENTQIKQQIFSCLINELSSLQPDLDTPIKQFELDLIQHNIEFREYYIQHSYNLTWNIDNVIEHIFPKMPTSRTDASIQSPEDTERSKSDLKILLLNAVWEKERSTGQVDNFITFLLQHKLDRLTLEFIDQISDKNPIFKLALQLRCADLMPENHTILTSSDSAFLQQRYLNRWASITTDPALADAPELTQHYMSQLTQPLNTAFDSSAEMRELSYTTMALLLQHDATFIHTLTNYLLNNNLNTLIILSNVVDRLPNESRPEFCKNIVTLLSGRTDPQIISSLIQKIDIVVLLDAVNNGTLSCDEFLDYLKNTMHPHLRSEDKSRILNQIEDYLSEKKSLLKEMTRHADVAWLLLTYAYETPSITPHKRYKNTTLIEALLGQNQRTGFSDYLLAIRKPDQSDQNENFHLNDIIKGVAKGSLIENWYQIYKDSQASFFMKKTHPRFQVQSELLHDRPILNPNHPPIAIAEAMTQRRRFFPSFATHFHQETTASSTEKSEIPQASALSISPYAEASAPPMPAYADASEPLILPYAEASAPPMPTAVKETAQEKEKPNETSSTTLGSPWRLFFQQANSKHTKESDKDEPGKKPKK